MNSTKVLFSVLLFLISVGLFGKSRYDKVDIWRDLPSKSSTQMLCYQAPEDNNTGAAVLIFPGGSYHHLGRHHEGVMVAEWFVQHGISAFVVYYRTSGRGYHHPAMIEDFQRSIQYVRENADKFKIDTTKIGAIGFSAGGHLAAMGGAFYQENYLEKIGIENYVSLRPDWLALIYPVVSMQDDIAHLRSRRNLLGDTVSQEQKDKFSMEKSIPDSMPPVFLLASKDDDVVNYRNSERLGQTLKDKNIKHKYLLYDSGGHGYGMKSTNFEPQLSWRDELYNWLIAINILK